PLWNDVGAVVSWQGNPSSRPPPDRKSVIRVVVADDHQLVREGIRMLLDRAADIEVVGEARSGEQAISLVEEVAPDVLVMDITMPGMSGITTSEIISQQQGTAVVILSMHEDEALVRRALASGAKGYVLKGSAADELLLAVRAAARGSMYLSQQASAGLSAATTKEQEPRPITSLTEREKEVLTLIGEGLTNRAIATRLGLSVKTIERHRTSLMTKLDVHTIVELVRVGITLGLIRLSPRRTPGE
ncbi:MAG: response regulator transcription factor, partial [Acidimicrobiia bacterium]